MNLPYHLKLGRTVAGKHATNDALQSTGRRWSDAPLLGTDNKHLQDLQVQSTPKDNWSLFEQLAVPCGHRLTMPGSILV